MHDNGTEILVTIGGREYVGTIEKGFYAPGGGIMYHAKLAYGGDAKPAVFSYTVTHGAVRIAADEGAPVTP